MAFMRRICATSSLCWPLYLASRRSNSVNSDVKSASAFLPSLIFPCTWPTRTCRSALAWAAGPVAGSASAAKAPCATPRRPKATAVVNRNLFIILSGVRSNCAFTHNTSTSRDKRQGAFGEKSHQMPELFALGIEISGIVRIGLHADGDLLDDFQAVALQPDDFLGIVREQPDRFYPQVREDLRPQAVFAQVHFVAQL